MFFESLLELSRLHARSASGRGPATSTRPLGFAPELASGPVYTEETFRHFLAVERRRVERSRRASFLLLVSFRGRPGKAALSRGVSRAVFRSLGQCVREVDFCGWFRGGRVAAAVLPQKTASPSREARAQVVARAHAVLRAHLPSPVVERMRVRVVSLQGPDR